MIATKKIHVVLIILLAILLGILITINSYNSYVYIATKWDSGAAYGRFKIMTEGKLFLPKHLEKYSWQARITENGFYDPTSKILPAIISIICGETDIYDSEKLHSLFPWPLLIFVPTSSVFFYHLLRKNYNINNNINNKSNYIYYALIFIFAIYPTSGNMFLLTYGAKAPNSVPRGFFILILILPLIMLFSSRLGYNRQMQIKLYLVFLLIFANYILLHHTWTYYLIFYLFGGYIWYILLSCSTLRYKKTNYSNIKRVIFLLISSLIIFLAVILFINTKLLFESIAIISIISSSTLLSGIQLKIFQDDKIAPYIVFLPTRIYLYSQIISSFLLIFIAILFLYYYFKYKFFKLNLHNDNKSILVIAANLIISYHLIHFFISFIWLLYNGIIVTLMRFFEDYIYIIILSATILLSTPDKTLRKVVSTVLVASVIISNIGYLSYPAPYEPKLTEIEWNTIKFLGETLPSGVYLFSDFRLAPPLLYFDHMAIITIDYPHYPIITIEILRNLYYTQNQNNIIKLINVLDEYIPRKPYCIFTSKSQEIFPIIDPQYKFNPASSGFQNKLTLTPLSYIYSANDIVRVYYRV